MKKANFTSVAAYVKGLALVAMTMVMSHQAQAQCALVCNNLANVSLDEDCIVPITPDMILNAASTSCPGGTLSVEVYKNAAGTGGLLPTSPNVTNTVINQTLLVKVKHAPSGNSCWGYIHVEDKLAPDVDATDVTVMCTQANGGLAPVITENCTSTLPPTSIDQTFDLPCDGVIGHLTGQNEVPAIETTGNGIVSGTYTPNAAPGTGGVLALTITYADLSSNLAAGHIHMGAAGANGGVVFNLFGGAFPPLVANQAGTLTRSVTLTAAQEVTLKANGFYVNLHTVNNPSGEVRAQILTEISAVTVRKWTVTDLSGNHATAQQAIFFARKHVQDVAFPADITVNCTAAANFPEHADGTPDPSTSVTGVPNVGGFGFYPNNTSCELNVAYTDQYFDICDGSYKVLRTWVVYDWCLPTGPVAGVTPPITNPRYHIQVIKVLDTEAPAFLVEDANGDFVPGCPSAETVSIDPWACTKDYDLPTVAVSENCSSPTSAWAVYTNTTTWVSSTISASIQPDPNWTGRYLVNYGTIQDLPIGDNDIKLYVKDACGNTRECTIEVNVFDGVPPIAICQEVTQVAVGAGYVDNFTCASMAGAEAGPNGPAADQQGEAYVPAASFNSGSYDKCGPVWLKVKRMDERYQCNPQNVTSEFLNGVNFCCSDLGQNITVILRVYDVDPGGAGPAGAVAPSALDGHYNDCMIQVLVEDKVKPVCQAPANKIVNCDEFDPLLWYGNLSYYDNCGMKNIDTSITYDGVGSGNAAQEKAAFEQCNFGRVTRRYTVSDCAGNTSACTQTITVNYKEQYRVAFPADRTITQCDTANTPTDQPQVFAENCEVIGISHEDQVFTVVPDACFKIIRKWCVINWCTYNPTLGQVLVTKSAAGINAPAGPIVWIGNGWSHATQVNATWPAPTAGAGSPLMIAVPSGTITASQLSAPGTPAYCYNQIIKVQDNQDPIITPPAYDPCDYTDNDVDGNSPAVRARHNGLWNNVNYYDPSCGSHDLCEGVKQLYIDAADACSKGDVNARYTLFLDLNGDGVMETVVNSENPTLRFGIGVEYIAANGSSNTLPFISGSYNDAQLQVNNGTAATANQISAAVKRRFFVTRDAEWDNSFPFSNDRFLKDLDLPYGNHKIKWTVEDNCGNDVTTEINVVVKDCKKPTIICKPLAGPIMNGPSAVVTVWASDWAEYTEDNCCVVPNWYSVRKQGAGFGSGVPPLTPSGGPITSVTFTCQDPQTTAVEIWTRDIAGNYDYCITHIVLNKANCLNPATANISGALKTEAAQGVEYAKVKVSGTAAGIPSGDVISGADGVYNLAGLPIAANYIVTPGKDINPTNGVSTYDLVLISKHILGAETFSTPYKHIAADVNKSGSVSTADIVELRKLILGITQDFPNNDSWRFVSKDYTFTTANPAGEAFAEAISVGQLQQNTSNKDFVSVKIGDINGSAQANSLMSVEDRTNGKLMFDVKDQAVKAGEEFTVNFKAAQQVAGYQFTLNFEGLSVSNVIPGAGMSKDNFATFAQEGAITTSFDGKVAGEFAITFRADRDGTVSQMLSLSNRITAAQAYGIDGENLEVAFRFDGNKVAGVAFELYQNTPNPVKDVTSISFNMVDAGAATLTITDAQGRVLVQNTANYAKGTNTVNVNRAQLASGVLFYEVATENAKAAKKMIVVE